MSEYQVIAALVLGGFAVVVLAGCLVAFLYGMSLKELPDE